MGPAHLPLTIQRSYLTMPIECQEKDSSMPRYMYRFYASTAVALVATGAFADLAAEDVWEDWKTYTTSFGYEVTGEGCGCG